jgi:hypothetical protein
LIVASFATESIISMLNLHSRILIPLLRDTDPASTTHVTFSMTPLTVDQQRTIYLSSLVGLMGQVRDICRHHVFTESKQTAELAAEAVTNNAAHGDLAAAM